MMAYRIRLTALVVLIGVAASSCGPRTVELELSMAPGEAKRVETVTESTMTMDSELGTLIVESNRSAQLTFTVLSVAESGDITFDVAIDDINLAMKTKMGETDFAAELGFGDMFARGMEAAKGEHFRLTVTPKGEVTSLEGVEALREKVVSSMTVPDQLRESFRGEEVAGESAIRDMVRPVFCRFPAGEVERASTWSIEEAVAMSVPAKITRTWAFAESDAPGVAALAYETSVETPPNAQTRVIGGMSGEVSLSGDGSGAVTVDTGDGWLMSREEEIMMTGMIQIKLLPMLPHGSDMPVTVAVRFRTNTLEGGEE